MGRLRVWIGLGISLLFLALLLRQVDAGELRDAFTSASPGWMVAAFAVYLVALWVRATRWRLVLNGRPQISAASAWSLVVIGYAANNVLPARAGELVRAELLHRRHGADRAGALASIVVERIFDGLILALFLGGAVLLAGSSGAVRVLAIMMVALFIGVTAILAVLSALGEVRSARLFNRVLSFVPQRIQPRARALTARFIIGITAVRGWRAWTTVLAATTLTWALEATMYWLMGEAFGLGLEPWWYIGVCGAANLAVAVPSSAGGIGPFEYFAREVVVRAGVATGLGTAYAVALHAVLMVPIVLIGLVLLWRHHLGLRSLVHASATANDDASLARSVPARPASHSAE